MKTDTPVKKEDSVLNENHFAELLIDQSIDAIIAIDCSCIVITWNSTAASIYKTTKKQAIGKSIFNVIDGLKDDKETVDAINRALKGNKTFVPASRQFAHRPHAENHYIPLHDNDGNVIGVMNIVHDVAHRIKAERQLQQLNDELEKQYRQLKLTADELASFTYITSNKIKEPIRHLYTGIEHLIKVEAGRLSDSGRASFRRIQSSINRMDLLLDDMLSLAQISILQKANTAIDLDELIRTVCDELKNKTEKPVSINIEELCIVTGHRDYLYLLFYNLIDNAIKFNESNPATVKVSCEKVFLDNETVKPFVEEQYYKISISDNAIGFENAEKERIFMMFEKLHDKKYKGSGMGLTLAQKIMHAHDGFIQVESEPGKGSAFHCFFPVTKE